MSGDGLQEWTAFFAAVALFCGAQGAFWFIRALSRKEEEQLGRRLRGQVGAEQAAEGGIKIRRLTSATEGALERLRTRVERLGIGSLSALVSRVGLLLLVVVVAVVLITGSPVAALSAGLVSLVGVQVYLGRRHAKLIALMDGQVPRALDLMVFSLRAGNGLEEAIRLAAEQVDAPLSPELRRCYQEAAMGRPIEAALEQLRSRWIGVTALGFFVEAVTVLKRTGGNLVEVLERMGTNLRAQAAFRAKHRALTAEGRMSGKILMALPFLSVGLQAVFAPQQLRELFDSQGGQLVLGAAALMWFAGAMWISRLTRPR